MRGYDTVESEWSAGRTTMKDAGTVGCLRTLSEISRRCLSSYCSRHDGIPRFTDRCAVFFIVYNITSSPSPKSRRHFLYTALKKSAQSGTDGAYDDEKIFGIPASVPCTPTGRRSSVSQFSLFPNEFQVGSTILIGSQSTLPLLARYADNRMTVPLRSAVDLSTEVFSASKSDYQCHNISYFQQIGLHTAKVGMPHGL